MQAQGFEGHHLLSIRTTTCRKGGQDRLSSRCVTTEKSLGRKVRTGARAGTLKSGNSQSDGIAANRSREGFEPATRRAAGSVDEVREMNESA
ncbi:MAG: hypothetical protein ABIS28_06920, partial [Caldimonas sp.]